MDAAATAANPREEPEIMVDGRIESVSDFLLELDALRRTHVREVHGDLSSLTFYRGHAEASWKLEPRLYREKLYLEEQNMIRDALHLLPGEFAGASEFRMLAKMQHYGLPTRLLDVTSNPLVALYFACLGHEDKDGTVFMFPNLPTFRERGYMVPITMRFVFREGWKQMCLQDFTRVTQHHYPIVPKNENEAMKSIMHVLCLSYVPVLAPHDNDRLQAQSGGFLLFGMDEESRVVSDNPGTRGKCYVDFRPAEVSSGIGSSIETSRVPEGGLQLTVPASAKERLLRELDRIDMNEWRLFPGIEGALSYIYRAYKSDFRRGTATAVVRLKERPPSRSDGSDRRGEVNLRPD